MFDSHYWLFVSSIIAAFEIDAIINDIMGKDYMILGDIVAINDDII